VVLQQFLSLSAYSLIIGTRRSLAGRRTRQHANSAIITIATLLFWQQRNWMIDAGFEASPEQGNSCPGVCALGCLAKALAQQGILLAEKPRPRLEYQGWLLKQD